mmetsp:Transcript_12864/g.29185  ORF Transcript_12864/g.29185 Transcript_12864/m.29185 type:complete len:244 (+) Transcript_12864:1720-2451(+)
MDSDVNEDTEVWVEDQHAHADPSSVVIDPVVLRQLLQLFLRSRQALVLVHVDGEELVRTGNGTRPLGRATVSTAVGHELQSARAIARLKGPLRVGAEPTGKLLPVAAVPRSKTVIRLRVPWEAVKVGENGVCPARARKGAKIWVLGAARHLPPSNLLDLQAAYDLVVAQHTVTVLSRNAELIDEHRQQSLLHVEVPVILRVDVRQILVPGSEVNALEARTGKHTTELPLQHRRVRNLLVAQDR